MSYTSQNCGSLQTRRGFFGSNLAKSTGSSNASADTSGVFLNTVRGALVVAEAELSGKDGQSNNISEALDDIRGLLAPVSLRHFNNRTGFKHILGDYFPMFQRQAIDWLKTFQRRMSPRCSVKHAWQVVVEEKLHRELFQILENIVSRTNFGVIADRTRKNCVFAFTSRDRVRKVFSDCTDRVRTLLSPSNSMTFHYFFHDLFQSSMTLVIAVT